MSSNTFPTGLAMLLNGDTQPRKSRKSTTTTTTTKEKPMKSTTTTTKETTVPTTETKAPEAVNTDALINEALVAIGAEIVAEIAHEEALRNACIAVHTATKAGASVRQLEKQSEAVVGRKISKTTIARYAKVGEAIIANPELVASEVRASVIADEKKSAKAKAKASKAEADTAEGDDTPEVDSVPVDLEFIVEALVDAPRPGLRAVSAHLELTDTDDYEVCLVVAQGALLASANLSGDDEVASALRVLAEAVAKIARTAE